ncbi:type II toxin-antitoxin system VapC family toxin [Vulcanisaeta souniana]|uniref:Nucleic acid-binding protein n=1 Tax=Vulcanisaeta souniana JCM 11219 TaxID=1293586 RepID=A0A830EH35_9CREN|nr:type II toxin-antitoxin system VapC family toxin [Vulcanisaeta souniana]BDR92497.1 nucleic acid-binding protein [Vulcanisaeta souniana JCM 11219]GGI75960.1 nucleic acid-binding protein [Vulcanisaeta souniana JCM 11219]
MRVIDSSALIKYFTRETGWERVRDLMLDGVMTVDLAIKEVANALWRKIIRGEVDYNIVLTIMRTLLEEAIPIIDQRKYVIRALELAVKYRITVYDAIFIVLALEQNMELITSDDAQADVAGKVGVRVILV